ncbi:uncharacterized protein LOC110857251 isoform X1 [Folsomia candida]|uniref:uncharacterized protein LOC110857251 isoform X1 n=2 Tax=Folsomia candida TaxID=158441 RepID=UPI0016053FAC|nr:uncharacterized protein LOC110857251 isoform X1 [Folsomia candida]
MKENMPREGTKNGTGHILQDLLSSTVLIARSNIILSKKDHQDYGLISENTGILGSCCICSESRNLRPIATQEMDILTKFVLNGGQMSLILQTEDYSAIFCCKICSSVLHSLAKLTTQIENITISLRAVISSRSRIFRKVKRETEIELPDAGCHADVVTNHGDDQLTGFVEEEEFAIKLESIDKDGDDEIREDPLYIPGLSEVARGRKSKREHVCTMCGKTFGRFRTLFMHMGNRNIHPNTHITAPSYRKGLGNNLFSNKLDAFHV